MIRTLIRNVAFLAAVGLGCVASQAEAGFVGSFGVNTNSPSISMPAGDDLSTATVLAIASMNSNGNTTGGFSGIGLVAGTPFTGGTITLSGSTFTFSNSTFGTFTETVAPVVQSFSFIPGVSNSETLLLLGNYSGGPVGTPAVAASFTISFTQNGGAGNSVSASGTLTIPPSGVVPEPASVALLGIGLASFAGYRLRRRFAN